MDLYVDKSLEDQVVNINLLNKMKVGPGGPRARHPSLSMRG